MQLSVFAVRVPSVVAHVRRTGRRTATRSRTELAWPRHRHDGNRRDRQLAIVGAIARGQAGGIGNGGGGGGLGAGGALYVDTPAT